MSAKHSAKEIPVKSAKPMPKWLPDLLGALAIYIAVVALFHSIVLEGKVFSAGDDTEASLAFNTFAIREAENGKYPLWCPELFGGFPSFAAGAYSNYEHVEAPYSLAYRWVNPRYYADMFTNYVLLLGNYDGPSRGEKWLVALMLYAGLIVYFIVRRLGFGVILAFLCGMVLAWNPYFISLITASHGGKLATFIYIPLLIYLAWQVMEKRKLFDFALFAMVFGWQIQHGGHTQVLFYSAISVMILFVTWAIFELREGGALRAATAGAYLAAGAVLAVGVGALWYVPLLEYVEYSIRGVGPALGSMGQGGYTMDDATSWSMAPSELITFVFPSWYGLKSPVYWGDMLFTSSSFYFGIVPLLLAILGILGKKSRFVWGLIALSVFSILLSFGKHFSLFYSLFFDYFPFFNKFRTPSLILLLMMMCAAILAAYGYRALEEKIENEKWKKYLFYSAIICTVLMIIVIIGGKSLAGSLASFSKDGEAQRYSAQQLSGLKAQRAADLGQDLAIRFTFLAAALWMCYLFIIGKMKQTALVSGLALITLVDLGSFAGKFFDPQPAAQQKALLKTNRVIDALKHEQEVFRVFPVGRLNQDNRWAAWGVQSLGGYHGAKLRTWQDLADNVFYNGSNRQFPLNYELLGSLNCKYVITEGLLPPELGLTLAYEDAGAKMAAYKLPTYNGRVYYAESVDVIEDRARTFETMKAAGFPFMKKCIVNKPLPGPVRTGSIAEATITSYGAHRVEISTTNGDFGLLVLSDAFYEPEWVATIDGQHAEIYLVNGFSRGVYLSPGSHTVVYEYVGRKESQGATVATVSHFLVLALVGVGFYMNRRKKTEA